jgi:hypothetical protein
MAYKPSEQGDAEDEHQAMEVLLLGCISTCTY